MYRNRFGFRIGFQGFHDLPAIHYWQLNIEKYGERFKMLGHFNAFISANGNQYFIISGARKIYQNLGKGRIVFNNENNFIPILNIFAVIVNRFRNPAGDITFGLWFRFRDVNCGFFWCFRLGVLYFF